MISHGNKPVAISPGEEPSKKALRKYVSEWMNGEREVTRHQMHYLATCMNDRDLEWLLRKGMLNP